MKLSETSAELPRPVYAQEPVRTRQRDDAPPKESGPATTGDSIMRKRAGDTAAEAASAATPTVVGGRATANAEGHVTKSDRSEKDELKALLRQLGGDDGAALLKDEATADRLLSLGWRCYDVSTSSDRTMPWADRVTLAFGRLLEAVTEAVLAGSYCALHRARLRAVQGTVTFFCRVKSRNAASATSSTHKTSRSPPSPIEGGGAAVDFPPSFIMQELRRRLQTYLWSLQCPPSHRDVDALRKRDLLESVASLQSPLLPLNITLSSVVLPLLEFLCCDMLMSTRLGDEVRRRLEEDINVMRENEELHSDLFQTVGAFWRLATAGEAAAARGLADRLSDAVGSLIQWVRANVGVLRMSNSLEELLGSVDPALRTALRQQEYESAEHFLQVFKGFDKSLKAIQVPTSSTSCRLPDGLASSTSRPSAAVRECIDFDLTLTQVLKDVSRERFLVQGIAVTPSDVQQSLTDLLQQQHKPQEEEEGTLGVAEVVRRTVAAASRTVFGGDTFFLVRELFGGEGVVVAPAAAQQQDPIEIRVETRKAGNDDDPGKRNRPLISVVVQSSNLYSIYGEHDLSQQGSATAIVNLSATVTEVLPMEMVETTRKGEGAAAGAGLRLREAATGRVRTISIDAQLPVRK